ncbi:hypothetical protein N7540_006496 [Penicillium herquei]|nr:hypothetical protein N7540_006496 [Penicillium herquei]
MAERMKHPKVLSRWDIDSLWAAPSCTSKSKAQIEESFEWTPVRLAANINDTKYLRMLVDAGANVKIQAHSGNPLCVALGIGNLEAVKYLIHDAKTNVNQPISDAPFSTILEKVAVECLVEAGAEFDPQKPFKEAFSDEDFEIRWHSIPNKWGHARKPLAVNGVCGGLLEVAATKSLSLVKLLAESGAEINTGSDFGDNGSPLIAASGPDGDFGIVEWFIGAGANMNMLAQHAQVDTMKVSVPQPSWARAKLMF